MLAAPELSPYLVGAGEGRCLLPHCQTCGRPQFPPRPTCRYCGNDAFEWLEAELHGMVYSWTTTHRAPVSSFIDEVPYTVVIVQLDLPDVVRLVGRLDGSQADKEIQPGARVLGRIMAAADDMPRLLWRFLS
jgi:uncharacterized OB-fold protein